MLSVSLGIVGGRLVCVVVGAGSLVSSAPVGYCPREGGWGRGCRASASVGGSRIRWLRCSCSPHSFGDDLNRRSWGDLESFKCLHFPKISSMCFLNEERAVAPSILCTHIQSISPGWSIQVAAYSRVVAPGESGLLRFDQGLELRFWDEVRVTGVTDVAMVSGGI